VGSFLLFSPPGRPRQISIAAKLGHLFSNQETTMDKVKAVYGYAVEWVAAHPAATVNAIAAAVVLKIVSLIVL
jgi:hypothetical protein